MMKQSAITLLIAAITTIARSQQYCIYTFPTSGQPIHSLALTPNKDFLFAGGTSSTVSQWQIQSTGGMINWVRNISTTGTVLATAGSLLATASTGAKALFWNVNDGTLASLSANLNSPLSSDQNFFYGANSNGKVLIQVSVVTQAVTQFNGLGSSTINAISCADGFVFVAFADSTIRQFNSSSSAQTKQISAAFTPSSLAVSGDWLFAATGPFSSIAYWSLTLATTGTLIGHSGVVLSMDISGDWLFSASADSTIRQWQVSSKQFVRVFSGHVGAVRSVLAAGSIFFSGGEDGAIKQWIIPEILPSVTTTANRTTRTTVNLSTTTATTVTTLTTVTTRFTATTGTTQTTPTTVTTVTTATTASRKTTSTTRTTTLAYSISINSSSSLLTSSTVTVSTSAADSTTSISISIIETITTSFSSNPPTLILSVSTAETDSPGNSVVSSTSPVSISEAGRFQSSKASSIKSGDYSGSVTSTFASAPLPSPANDSLIIIAGVSASVGVLLVSIAAVLFLLRKRRQRRLSGHKAEKSSVQELPPPISLDNLISSDQNVQNTIVKPLNEADIAATQTFTIEDKGIYVPASYMIPSNATYVAMTKIYENVGCKVFKARIQNNRELLERSRRGQVAIKMFLKISPKFADAFNQEISLMFFFNDKPNFVKLVGFCNNPYTIVTDYYALGSLDKALIGDKKSIRSTKRIIVQFCLQISGALREMHAADFSHSDLKPHNIFVDKNDGGQLECYLGDFGLAKVLDVSHLKVKAYQVHNVKGFTVAYAAPELMQRHRQRTLALMSKEDYFEADIYSMGCMIYEMMVGCLVWRLVSG